MICVVIKYYCSFLIYEQRLQIFLFRVLYIQARIFETFGVILQTMLIINF